MRSLSVGLDGKDKQLLCDGYSVSMDSDVVVLMCEVTGTADEE